VGATGAALGNGGFGISVADARDVTIGPPDPTVTTLLANEIANNGADPLSFNDDGVNVQGSLSDTIQMRGNSMHDNVGLGIRLQDNSSSTVPGVSVPPPSISVDNFGGVITATGTINAAQAACVATSTCIVDIYLADSGSEGVTYKATQENVGAGGYSIDLSSLVSPHQFITATTTDDGNTSQFQTRVEVPEDGSS
jgi:hypothetical protein